MLDDTATAKRRGMGLMPAEMAEDNAMGDISTAVAVLDINMVSRDVVKYMAASSATGPNVPMLPTNASDIRVEAPVFSNAVDIGIMAAMSTMLSQLMVL